jgi:uncharacterized protein (DUF4415 family)
MPNSEIDTSDSPEVTDWSGAERGGDGYQTRINAALRDYVERQQR